MRTIEYGNRSYAALLAGVLVLIACIVGLQTTSGAADRPNVLFVIVDDLRPHLPFVAPTKYWDLYDREKLSMADNPFLPRNAPVMAMNSAYELKGCYDLEDTKHPAMGQLSEETARRLKHGYYASVSYVDACFEKLMKGLNDLGLADDTIVVVWGDHGWKLGEHGSWCKQTNFDIDVRVPLMIRVPWTSAPGVSCERLVELVDLYPTICDVAGIAIPDDMEGTSLKPLLSNPKMKWKSAAFSQFHRSPGVSPDRKRYMGYSMVRERYHYVEWRFWDHVAGVSSELAAVELYDQEIDPGENTNIAGEAKNQKLVKRLARQLKAEWPKRSVANRR